MTRLTKTSNNLKKTPRSERQAYVALAAGLVGLLLLAAIFRGLGWSWREGALGGFQCPFEWLTHAPCPLCGGTRVFFMLAEGRIVDAILFAPGPALLLLGAIGAGGLALLNPGGVWASVLHRLPWVAVLLLVGVWPAVLLRTWSVSGG